MAFTVSSASASTTPTKPSPLKGNAWTKAEAVQRANIMLDRVQLPGLVRQPPPKSYGIVTFVTDGRDVQQLRWFKLAGHREAVIHYLRLHPPRGFTLTDTFHSPAWHTSPASTEGFAAPSDRPNSDMEQLSFSAIEAKPGQVELEVEAHVKWVPPRSRVEALPRNVTKASVDVDAYDRPLHPGWPRHVRLTTAKYHKLAAGINALQAKSAGDESYCSDYIPRVGALTVTYGTHRAVFSLDLGDCYDIRVTVDGHQQPTLKGTPAIGAEFRSLFHP